MRRSVLPRPHSLLRRLAAVAGMLLVLGLPVAAAQPAVSTVTAASGCAPPATTLPTGPASVAASLSGFGRVLVVGSGPNAGCSLYTLTGDQPTASPPHYACSGFCATTVWPALLTSGVPLAGPGIDPALLGTVTRTDILSGQSVAQVTYAGQPLYQFSHDPAPGQTNGADLFDGKTAPPGVWYLRAPARGLPAPGIATLSHETALIAATGKTTTVLAALRNSNAGQQLFPVYTFSADTDHQSACQGLCAVFWPPLLATQHAQASDGVSGRLGILVRPDGSHQVTFDGQPLYLFVQDAGTPGSVNGAGVHAFGGTFDTLPPQ